MAKNPETYVIAIFAIHHSVRGGAKNPGLGETARHTAEILRSRAQIETVLAGSERLSIPPGKTALEPELVSSRRRYWTTIDPFMLAWNSQK
jgi:hypothetical protein